jgi:hypothetical protein
MAEHKDGDAQSIVVKKNHPLIGLLIEENGEWTERYFSSEEDARAAVAKSRRGPAKSLAGVWSDLDTDEMLRELDRIRHESPPSPSLEL